MPGPLRCCSRARWASPSGLETHHDLGSMALGTKNRIVQVAEACRRHLRETYANQAELVEEYIVEQEGPEHACDPARWLRFTDVKRSQGEMLARLEADFQAWLQG